jgi:hypothetical protein
MQYEQVIRNINPLNKKGRFARPFILKPCLCYTPTGCLLWFFTGTGVNQLCRSFSLP